MKKKFFFIFLIILLIVIGIFFYTKEIDLSLDNLLGGKKDDIQENQLDRREIMEDVAEKIADISPVKPVLGGSWYVNRFWFIKDSNEDFYVEYEDGHIMRRILLSAEEKKEHKLAYELIGYFEPGEVAWILKEGEDSFFGRSLDLYEHDEESNRWVRKN